MLVVGDGNLFFSELMNLSYIHLHSSLPSIFRDIYVLENKFQLKCSDLSMNIGQTGRRGSMKNQ